MCAASRYYTWSHTRVSEYTSRCPADVPSCARREYILYIVHSNLVRTPAPTRIREKLRKTTESIGFRTSYTYRQVPIYAYVHRRDDGTKSLFIYAIVGYCISNVYYIEKKMYEEESNQTRKHAPIYFSRAAFVAQSNTAFETYNAHHLDTSSKST